MNLKPQDIVVALKLLALGQSPWTYNQMALDLGMSPAEVHAASKRLVAAKLVLMQESGLKLHIHNLEEFLFHGIQYVFVVELGGLVRGIPTSVSAPVLSKHFQSADNIPQVWPDENGTIRGESFSPLYSSVPVAAGKDEYLYELLALVDALRAGRVREKDLARKELKRRFEKYEKGSKP